MASIFSIVLITTPPVVGLPVIEKGLATVLTKEECDKFIASYKVNKGARIEVRESIQLDPAVVAAERVAKEARLIAEKKEFRTIRRLNKKAEKISSAVANPTTESKVTSKVKVTNVSTDPYVDTTTSKKGPKFKPLNLNNLNKAIGVDSLTEVCKVPQRPDTTTELAQYVQDLRSFLKALICYEAVDYSDPMDNLIYKNVYKSSIVRIENEILTAEKHAVLGVDGSMPDWPLNLPSDNDGIHSATVSRLSEDEKLAAKKKLYNSLIRKETGNYSKPGAIQHKKLNYDHGKGFMMKVGQTRCSFSHG